MELVISVTFVLGFSFVFLFVIPRLINSNQSKGEAINSNNKNTSKGAGRYTKAEVSLHNKRTDCWIIIKDKVYDVTPYVEEHPGGDAILTNAGADSTEGFFGPQHGTRVFDIIEDFCIGELDQ